MEESHKCTGNKEVIMYLREILAHIITIEGVMGKALDINVDEYSEAIKNTREEMKKNGI